MLSPARRQTSRQTSALGRCRFPMAREVRGLFQWRRPALSSLANLWPDDPTCVHRLVRIEKLPIQEKLGVVLSPESLI